MKDLVADSMRLDELIGRLRDGRFEIPDFQREFEWHPKAINDLMRSIFRDYYIGSLLLWKGKDAKGGKDNFELLSCERLSGYEGDNKNREWIVLDGQQRLSAIYYSFFAPDKPAPKLKSRAFHFIRLDRFMVEDYQGAFQHRFSPLEIPKDQYEKHCFPLSTLGKGTDTTGNWLRGYAEYWRQRKAQAQEAGEFQNADHYENYQQYGDRFRAIIDGLLQHYKISYIQLNQDIDIAKVCDIFTKINSTGVKLDMFDLLNAMLKPKEVLLKKLWRDAREESPELETPIFRRMNIYVLQVMSILLQGDCSPKYLPYLVPRQQRRIRKEDGSFDHKVYIADSDEFILHWDHSIVAIKRARDLLSGEYGAIVPKFIPYPAILPVFAALRMTAAGRNPAITRRDAFDKVKRWYWASVFTGRYAQAVETTAARDYREVCAWMEGGPPPDVITQRVEDLRLHDSTQQGAAIYNGVINLIVLKDAKDWYTGESLNPKDIDDHHIVPKSWGKKHLGTEKEINTILNRTPLSSETNRRVIGSDLPYQYLPAMIDRYGEDEVRKIFDSHLIPEKAFDILLKRNPFTPEDFKDFTEARKRAIHSAIERLLINPGG